MRAILNYCLLFFRKIPIIMPDSNFKLIWDIIMMFTVLLNLLYIPLNLSFEFSDSNDALRYFFDEFLFIMFLTEVILSLFTAYYSKGILIRAKKKIIKNYFAYEYYIDFLTIFPYLVRKVYDFDSLNIFLLFRIFKMKKIFRKLEDHLHLSDQVKGFYELSKLILIIVYVGHFFACAWIYMANMQIKAGETITWLHGQNIIDKSWLEKYIFSLYFSVYTMVTVGYGDISSNIAEKLFCIIMMIMSCGVFAYSINRLGSILEEMYQKETEFKF